MREKLQAPSPRPPARRGRSLSHCAFGRASVLASLLQCGAFLCLAHDSPEHKVAELSFEMARSGKSVSLFMQRGIEHRALGELGHAAADFEAASRLDPKLTAALKELSLVQLAQGKTGAALETINRALASEAAPDLLMTRAEVYAAERNYRAALRDCETAFMNPNVNLEWYLLRAEFQRQLALFEDCLRDLREGFEKTGSAVLREESIDAMIDAGHYKAALKEIERELRESRWRSSWLIRRGRARIGLGENKAARRDLEAALSELNQRVMPGSEDVSLLVDRALAHALLGDKARAGENLRQARWRGAELWMLWRVEREVGAAGLINSTPPGSITFGK